MIGPVSGTGRAMMASLQQAIQKGMPPDQAVQYVKSMATQGVAPLADLYAMMNQFQRLKQPQAQAPQTPPTIKDQLNILDQQQQMQQMQQQQAVPMDRGLGGIDAGLMQYPQFAGGGIVALSEGGDPTDVARKRLLELIDEAEKSGDFNTATVLRGQLRRMMTGSETSMAPPEPRDISELFRSSAASSRPYLGPAQPAPDTVEAPAPTPTPSQPGLPAPSSPFSTFGSMMSAGRTDPFGRPVSQDLVAAPPAPPRGERGAGTEVVSGGRFKRFAEEAPKESTEYLKEIQALRESQGLGKARKERMDYLTKSEQELAKEYGSDKMLAFAEAGFRMAGAASRPGATFLGALAEGAMSGTQALRALNKEQRATKRAMQEAMFQIKEAEEAEKEGNITAAMNMRENARNRYDAAQKLNMQLDNDITKLNMQLGASREIAQIQAGTRGGDDALRGKKFDLEIVEKLLEDARERLLYAQNAQEKQEIQKEIRGYLQQMRGMGTSGAGVPVTTSGW
jgi:hypothetical protein